MNGQHEENLADVHPVRVPVMTSPPLPWLLPALRLVVFVVGVVVITAGIWQAQPPRDLTIEVGPVGGSYYENAVRYRDILATRGITLHIVPTQNSMDILKDVDTKGSGIDVGFVAQDVGEVGDEDVFTIGLVQLQPLFIFASASLGRHSVLDDLRGRKIVSLPANSVTTAAALRVFELYDITPENSSFTFLPLADAVRELRAGRFDAGVFMLAPENKVVREMAEDSGLHLVPMTEARAITHELPFLQPVLLPRGIYSIADAIPPNDVGLLAARVAVIARKGLHPWLVYSLLDAIRKTHHGATLISDAGEYPTIVGSQIEVDPLVAEWYQTGMPWIWRQLPPGVAGFIYSHALLLLVAVLFSGVIITVAFLGDLAGLALATLNWVRRRRRPGESA